MARLFLVAISFALFTHWPAAAQEWTRFRGPNGNGNSDATTIPANFSSSDYNWRVPLPGIGHSSPVLWGSKLFITSADSKSAARYLICLNTADGSTLWKREFDSTPHHLHSRNSYASGSAAVDADQVYVSWATPEKVQLHALDHAGKSVWTANLGPFTSQHGYGNSPVVYKDMVLIGNEQMGASHILALNRKSGKIRWRTERPYRRAAYCTPCVFERPGRPDEIVFNSGRNGISSVDPVTGKEKWKLEVFDKRSVSSPLIAGGLIFGTTGSGGGGNYLAAVRPPSKEGEKPSMAYKIAKSAPYVPTPVAYGEMVFLWSDKGVVTCIDAPTGKVHWQKRVGNNYSGSPVRVDDRICCIAEDGELVVLRASKEYELIARIGLGEDSRATPAISDGVMYLRTYSHLISVGGSSR